MSAPVKKCEVTPLEALLRLIAISSMIDTNECKSELIYNTLQGEIAVAKEVAKTLSADPVVPVAAQPVVPEGWRVVPIRPTHEMVRAACDAMGATQSVMLAIEKAPLPPFVGALKFDPAKLNQLIHDFGNASFEIGEWKEGDEGETIYQIHARCDAAKAALVQHICSLAAPSLEAQPAGEVIPADKLCALLPGPYYMDPPDGGSVPVLEQVERMAKDAARYRWLLANYATGDGYHKIDAVLNGGDADEYLNAAIDEAMAQGEKHDK
jgi:hypothetical protein